MAIKKNNRFPITHGEAFPHRLMLMTPIAPAIKYNPDRNAAPEQKFDFDPKTGEGTGLPLWTATVTDPHEATDGKGKRASFEITFIAQVQPVPAGEQVAPGTDLWWIELEGLTAEPKVMGQGEFKYLGYTYRATGIKGDNSGAKQAPANPGASRPRDEKAA
ncbi:hypothetical protein [Nocardia macrotermitis]|uniref:Plasmid replication, integration and excision activator n=1 Tax=Nocardia macrotermitis TaxID=2585198 RepID=A0A7K0D259_9NOCA|nr:hypothetical protein [Nocardia macrotermitis]MQY19342.1 hypothetical protein [Nocardia macrotermitis]